MTELTATAQAAPNIAFVKYWGNHDNRLRLPANGSISMNLDGLHARTTVRFVDVEADTLSINGKETLGVGLERISAILDEVRAAAGFRLRGQVSSENNFPTGTGIASGFVKWVMGSVNLTANVGSPAKQG